MANGGVQRRDIVIILVLIAVALVIGMLGFRLFVGRSWLDAFYESAMVLSGVGATENPTTASAKIFIAIYALASSLILIAIIAYIIAQVLGM